MPGTIEPHDENAAAVCNSGGALYEDISHGIAGSVEHCVLRLELQVTLGIRR